MKDLQANLNRIGGVKPVTKKNTIMAIKYDIVQGKLYTDLDTPYDAECNKIDVYTSVSWGADTEEEYQEKEKIIDDWKFENNLVKCNAWCDISGYNYWMVEQQEENYVSVDVYLKKKPSEYTQLEMQEIGNIITEADDYFIEKLT